MIIAATARTRASSLSDATGNNLSTISFVASIADVVGVDGWRLAMQIDSWCSWQ